MRIARIIAIAAACAIATPASAALPIGAKAPDFQTRGALAGKPFRLHLAEQLKHGAVVLYFFPAAFTEGCTIETKMFADQHAAFRKAGARVIGLSADSYDKLAKFSVEACRNRFPVATATPDMIKAYDVALMRKPGLTDRTSYVITPNGRIVEVHSDLDYREHVKLTLAAVQRWKGAKR